jgi:hypothetical protein
MIYFHVIVALYVWIQLGYATGRWIDRQEIWFSWQFTPYVIAMLFWPAVWAIALIGLAFRAPWMLLNRYRTKQP